MPTPCASKSCTSSVAMSLSVAGASDPAPAWACHPAFRFGSRFAQAPIGKMERSSLVKPLRELIVVNGVGCMAQAAILSKNHAAATRMAALQPRYPEHGGAGMCAELEAPSPVPRLAIAPARLRFTALGATATCRPHVTASIPVAFDRASAESYPAGVATEHCCPRGGDLQVRIPSCGLGI